MLHARSSAALVITMRLEQCVDTLRGTRCALYTPSATSDQDSPALYITTAERELSNSQQSTGNALCNSLRGVANDPRMFRHANYEETGLTKPCSCEDTSHLISA